MSIFAGLVAATAGFVDSFGILGAFIVSIRLFKQHRVDKVKKWFDKWGAWAVFIAAFTPIPFKVFTWCGGIFKIKLKYFILASIAGRFLQFFIAAYVGNLLGPSF